MEGGLPDLDALEKLSELAQHIYFWLALLFAGVLAGLKFWRSRKAPNSFLSLVRTKYGAGTVLDRRLLRRLTCAVVDDKPADFPIEFMRGFFGSVVAETKVSLNDASRLSEFDVIFLDVADVVSEDAQRGGALLVERIRQYRTDNIVVSVSSKKYDVEVTRYFEAADIRIRKPVTASSIEEQFIAHLANKIGPEALAREVDDAVRRVSGPRKLKSLVKNFIASRGGDDNKIPHQVQLAGVSASFLRLIHEIRKLG